MKKKKAWSITFKVTKYIRKKKAQTVVDWTTKDKISLETALGIVEIIKSSIFDKTGSRWEKGKHES